MNDIITFKQVFESVSDEFAERIGAAIASELMLKPSREYPDRWDTAGGTFTNKGLARRVARIYIECSI